MTKVAQNKFTEGLTLDTHPLVSMDSSLTNCLNGTLLTLDGNELLLQNDYGNTKVCDLNESDESDEKFYPIGVKEYNGIIYITSVNKKGEFQIGSYCSPEKNNKSSKNEETEIEYPSIYTNKNIYTLKQYTDGDNKKINFTLHSGEDIEVNLKKICDDQGDLDDIHVLSTSSTGSLFNIEAYLLLNNHLTDITKLLYETSKYTLKQSEYGNLRYVVGLNPLEQVAIYDLYEDNGKIKLKLIIFSKYYKEFLYNLKLKLEDKLYEISARNIYNSDYTKLEYLVDIDTNVSSYSLVKEYNNKNYIIYSGTENINKDTTISRFKINKFSYKYDESTKSVIINYEIISTILDKDVLLDFNLKDRTGEILGSSSTNFKISPDIQIKSENHIFDNIERDSFFLLIISDDLGKTVDILYIITLLSQIELYYNNFRNDIINPIFETGRITSSSWNVSNEDIVEELYDNKDNVYLNFREYNDTYSIKVGKILTRNGNNRIGFRLLESYGENPYIHDIKFKNPDTEYKIDSTNSNKIKLWLNESNLTINHDKINVTFFTEIFPSYDTNKITLKFKDNKLYIEGHYIDVYNDEMQYSNNKTYDTIEDLIVDLQLGVFSHDSGLKNDSILMLNIEIPDMKFQYINKQDYTFDKTIFLYRYNSDFYFLNNISLNAKYTTDNDYYYKYYKVDENRGNVLDIILDYSYNDSIISGTIKFNTTYLKNDSKLLENITTEINKYTPKNKLYIENIYNLLDKINSCDIYNKREYEWKKDGKYFYCIKYDKYIKLCNTDLKPVRACCIFNTDNNILNENTLNDISKSEEELNDYDQFGNFYSILTLRNKELKLVYEDKSEYNLLTLNIINET